jgi:nitrogenase molybdenum-iron protein alpha/beta subunit
MDKCEWDNVNTHHNSCTLTGAAAFFAGIPDAAIVINGPLWCYFYAQRYVERSCPTVGNRFYCSQTDNHAVVYGTEDCLMETLQLVKENSPPSVLLIENSCAISLIGDDTAGIAAQAELPCPIVCMDSGGLKGAFSEGYQTGAKAYFAKMPLNPRGVVKPHTVNLLGCTLGYYNAANDLRELKRMLQLAGYEVVACPGAGSSTEEIATMTKAELNIVVHEELGGRIAQYLQKEYGMPYVSLLPPYGIEGSISWLRAIGQIMWMGDQSYLAVQQEADQLRRHIYAGIAEMQKIWGDPTFEGTLLVAPSSIALGMAQALGSEWVDTGDLTVVLQNGTLSYPISTSITTTIHGQGNSLAIERELLALSGGLLLGSSNEKAMLQQKAIGNVLCQNIALPVYDEVILTQRPFMGLGGACHMTEKLWNGYGLFCQKERGKR